MPTARSNVYRAHSLEPFGAIVHGLDLSTELDDPAVEEILDLLGEHHVLVFRGHHPPTDAALVAFMGRFGDLTTNHLTPDQIRPGHPEILVVTHYQKDGKYLGVGRGSGLLDWHTDYSWQDKISKVACLEAMEVAKVGGETWFSNMYALYESLDPDRRHRFEELQTVHETDAVGFYEGDRPVPRAIHPMIITNPHTGRRAVYVNRLCTRRVLGVSEEESRALLDELFERAMEERFKYEHKWQVGDLVLWDELGLVHSRNPYDPKERRYMRQVMALIENPAAAWPNRSEVVTTV